MAGALQREKVGKAFQARAQHVQRACWLGLTGSDKGRPEGRDAQLCGWKVKGLFCVGVTDMHFIHLGKCHLVGGNASLMSHSGWFQEKKIGNHGFRQGLGRVVDFQKQVREYMLY